MPPWIPKKQGEEGLMAKREKILTLRRDDFKFQTFKSGGKGGQHQNKTDSGVRIIHEASGARGESRTERSQLANKKLAFKRLTESAKFKTWLNRKVFELTGGQSIDERVDEMMQPGNLQVEIVDNDGRWVDAEAKKPEEALLALKKMRELKEETANG